MLIRSAANRVGSVCDRMLRVTLKRSLVWYYSEWAWID